MDRVKRARDKEIKALEDTVDLADMLLKLDEITDWITNHDFGFEALEKKKK